jgi:osmoprotectant transport system permease protein
MSVFASPRDHFVDWGWVADHLDDIRADLLEHLRLTVIAVVVGLAIASVLSVVALRWRWSLGPITWVTGILYTIPSLAMFVFLVPVTGIGDTRTAEIPLVSYTLLILVRNIVAGIEGVPAEVRDAADGMGYRRWRRLLRVELPLALPAIIAGIRIATVTTVGLVTITALVGLGGLGDQIFAGLSRQFSTQVVVGAGLSVALSLVLDVLLVVVERALTPWRRRRVLRPEPMLEVTA